MISCVCLGLLVCGPDLLCLFGSGGPLVMIYCVCLGLVDLGYDLLHYFETGDCGPILRLVNYMTNFSSI
jgi:hypothetical protein